MSTLVDKFISSSFHGLLHVNNDLDVSASLPLSGRVQIQDGVGVGSSLFLGRTSAHIQGQSTVSGFLSSASLRVGNLNFPTTGSGQSGKYLRVDASNNLIFDTPLPATGIAAGTYRPVASLTVNAQGQISSIVTNIPDAGDDISVSETVYFRNPKRTGNGDDDDLNTNYVKRISLGKDLNDDTWHKLVLPDKYRGWKMGIFYLEPDDRAWFSKDAWFNICVSPDQSELWPACFSATAELSTDTNYFASGTSNTFVCPIGTASGDPVIYFRLLNKPSNTFQVTPPNGPFLPGWDNGPGDIPQNIIIRVTFVGKQR